MDYSFCACLQLETTTVAHIAEASCLMGQDIPLLPSLFPIRGLLSSELFFFFSISTSLAIHAMGRHIT